MLEFKHDRYSILDENELYLDLKDQEKILLNEKMGDENGYEKLSFEICDVDKYVKVNDWKPITNPIIFDRNMTPTSDGLLSNEIFGITKEDRAGIFAYIDLKDTFLDPSCYKEWCKLDSNVKSIVHETKKYSINEKGEFIEDENGKTGISFLKANINKIKFRRTGSLDRDLRIEFITKNKKKMFITKYLVIPAYYRDANTSNKSSSGVGYINKIYANLIRFVASLDSTKEYGFDNSGIIRGRIQETLLQIYDWFAGTTNSSISAKDAGVGMKGKFGLIRRVNRSKTVDYASRMVLAAPNLKVERPDELIADYDYSAMPLAATMANYYPFMVFHVKRTLENWFNDNTLSYYYNKKDKTVTAKKVKDPLIQFSDERISKEIKNFLRSFNDRFKLLEVELEDGTIASPIFNGKYVKAPYAYKEGDPINDNEIDIESRPLTWLDIFYMAAVEATRGRYIMITRYPIDSYWNEFFTKIHVSSTIDTKPAIINGNFYKWYPYIPADKIGKNTGNLFIDTMIISNLYLEGIGGDYDGDTCIVRGVYLEEANEEIAKHVQSKKNILNLSGSNVRTNSKDAIYSLYCITRTLAPEKLTNPIF